jgi:hypothetical protein
MSRIEIVPVTSKSLLNSFIELPWKIYAHDENWVPPLKKAVRKLLDTAEHPFWKFSEQALFLARRNSQTVGRIAGIIDNNYNQFHQEKMGAWGFFECDDDPEAAKALFSSVEKWATAKGMDFLRGPLNPSTNYEVGMLIEGFDLPPVLMMTYNPPYYVNLCESCGFKKEKDLVAILLVHDNRASARVERLARRIRKHADIHIRAADKKRFYEEMDLIKDIYNSAWSRNWGFVPMTDDEMNEMGKELVRIMDPDLIFFIYWDQHPVGICVLLPDINPLLKRFNGKIGISGLLKILLHKHEIKGIRGLVMGFKKSHQRLGLPLLAFDYLNRILRDGRKYEYLESGWHLEDNDDINKFEIEAGGKIHKRYRIFRKSLSPQ